MINFVNTKKDDGTKLLANKDELLNNKNLKEGNIAVVYNNTLKNIQHGELLQYINFPETVTLPKPLSETLQMQVSVPALLEPATDEPIQTSAFYISTQTVSFSYLFEDSTAISVMYVSTDTQHFTRTRFEKINAETNEVIESLKNPVDLSKEVKVMTSEIADLMAGGDANLVDDVNTCLYFAQTGGEEFGGVYKCNLVDGQLKYELLADDINNYIASKNKGNTSSAFKLSNQIIKAPTLDFTSVTQANLAIGNFEKLQSIDAIINTSALVTTNNMFNNCKSLVSVPAFDISNVTDMRLMFLNCNALATVPVFNMGSATNIGAMFANCTSLTDDSLNNILASLLTATKITTNKELKFIGLTSAQATTCTTLSNWAACEEAGWTTGY